MLSIFTQLLFNGIIIGAIYALVASGFSLIYSTGRFVHLAHGSTVAFSSYIFFWFFAGLNAGFLLSALFAILSAMAIGYLMNRFFYRPLRERGASSSALLIGSVGLLIFVESILLMTFGADVKIINLFTDVEGFSIFGAIVTYWQAVIVAISLVVFVGLYLLMKKTKMGKAMRAVADNKDVAEILGISAEKIYTSTFLIGSAIAGVAAILISVEQNLEPTMGINLIISGFTGAVIGGVGSVPGAVLGSFLLGLVQNFGIWYLPSGYKDVIAFSLLFVFLLFRPQGIWGVKNNK